MATITSAQSGPSNVGSTWVGGVVPGTTFAGTRTTTGVAYPVGTTVIALAAGSVPVTANRWIKFAGHSSYHRVTTGVTTAAGNITLTQGLTEAIPAAATSVSVDMVDDKVVIAHPGTNNASTTAYRTSGALAAGSTAIVLSGGAGTVTVGECLQFEHQIGTDEDGQPVYDNTYYLITALNTGQPQIAAPGLLYNVASGTVVVNRGHVVELVADHVWGDDTSSATVASNAVVVSGTIKASRSVSQTLTCRGTIFVSDGGTFDYGDAQDSIPATTATNLSLNDSAAFSTGKHVLSCLNRSSPTFKIRGFVSERNTVLTSGIAANATSISVASSAGWRVGDRLILQSDTEDPTRAQVVTITGGSGPTWSVTAVSVARAAGCRVGYLSSNVVIKAYSPTAHSSVGVNRSTNSSGGSVRLAHFRAENLGASGWTGIAANPTHSGFAIGGSGSAPVYGYRFAVEHTSAGSSGVGADSLSGFAGFKVEGCAIAASASATAFTFSNGSSGVSKDNYLYTGTQAYNATNGAGCSNAIVSGGFANASSQLLAQVVAVGITFKDGFVGLSNNRLLTPGIGDVSFENCNLFAKNQITTNGSAVPAKVSFNFCQIGGGLLAASNTTGVAPSQRHVAALAAINANPDDNRVLSYYQTTVTDTTTRRRSSYSVDITPKVANTDIFYTFTLPAVAGVAQLIKGSLRFDGIYTDGFPPRITLSGQGVNQSFTAPATQDAWHDFALAFTPTSTGDITATVTVRSPFTSGSVWLDGVYHYPMTQSVRHYGYQWLPQAAQIVDSRITLTEAQALALPVVVDHTAQTITVTGTLTARQVFEACMADLVQTANQARAVHITSATGETFATSYTVIGSISGPYTDATGLHVTISAPNLIALTRVQLWDVVAGTEIHNAQMTAAGFRLPLVWTADRTIRLRAGYAEGAVAKLPIESVGVLTSSGLTFLDAQADDAVYNAIGLDGGLMTEFTPDYPNLAINVTDPDGITSVQRLYAWAAWSQTSELGIRLMFRAVQASDTANFQIDQSLVNAKLKNANAAPVMMVGGYLTRKDGSTVIAASSGSIQMDPGKAYVAAGGGGSAAEVWSYASRTLTNGQLLLASGERVVTLADGQMLARG